MMQGTGNNPDHPKSLSILIDRDGLSFYDGLSRYTHTYPLCESCRAEQIAGIFSDVTNEVTGYAKINVVVNTPRFAVVPASMYDAGQNHVYLQTNETNFDPMRDTLIVSDYGDMVFLMAVESVIAVQAESSFRNVVFMHPLLASLLIFEKEAIACGGSMLTAHLFSHSVSLTMHREGRLLFCEMFGMENACDLMFYMNRMTALCAHGCTNKTVVGRLMPETASALREYDPAIRIEGMRAYDRL